MNLSRITELDLGDLTSVALPDATLIEYLVDGLGRRVGKVVDSALEDEFYYADGLAPVAWIDANGDAARFVYGTRANVPDYMTKDGVTYRIVSDHLGSPRLVVNVSTGAVVQQTDYDAFGRATDVTVAMGWVPIPFGFAGGLYDRDTGLVRFGARDYDPEVGRWIAKDPILFAGGDGNLYGYVLGDPVNLLDLTGYRPLTPNERTFLRGVFGNTLNPAPIQIESTTRGTYTSGFSSTIYFNERDLDPVTGEVRLADIWIAGTLAHEATHVWQRQYGLSTLRANFDSWCAGEAAYDYRTPRVTGPTDLFDRFVHGGLEQQATIVGDAIRSARGRPTLGVPDFFYDPVRQLIRDPAAIRSRVGVGR